MVFHPVSRCSTASQTLVHDCTSFSVLPFYSIQDALDDTSLKTCIDISSQLAIIIYRLCTSYCYNCLLWVKIKRTSKKHSPNHY